MKRLISIFVIVILLLVGVLVALPFAFKGKISRMVLQKANESVNATLTYGSYHLTLLKSFPDLTATFTDICLVGKGVFATDTLASVREFTMKIDLSTIWKKEAILVKSLEVNNGILKLIESENEKHNWEIENVPQSTSPKPESKPLKMLMPKIIIRNFDFSYISRLSNYTFSVLQANGQLSGVMEGMNTILNVVAETPSLNFKYGNVDYIKNGKITIETKLLADLNKFEFQFNSGNTKVNNMPLKLEGVFAMPNDSMLFDFKFDVPDISMKQVFGLIPDDYLKYMKDVDASGDINFNGIVKGVYYNDTYPLIDVNFNIANGTVKYPGLPDQLIIDQLSANISKPDGPIDLLLVGIKNLQMKLAKNPFSMHANFSNLFADPHLDVALKGVIDLESLSKLIPMGDIQLKGMMDANATVVGNYSALEKNDYNSFVSAGSIQLKNFYLKNSSVPQGVSIKNAALVLKNQNLQVNGLNGNFGKSDFALKGQLNNLLTYVFEDKLLVGNFEMNSNFIDINEFMTNVNSSNSSETKSDTVKLESKPMEFPKNMQLNFAAKIGKLRYDKIDISNFSGGLELKNQQLKLSGLSMNMIDGQLKMNGTILADGRSEPDVDLDLEVLSFDLPSASRNISMVQKFLPFAEKSQGEFSTALKIKSKLTSNLKMILPAITASGKLSTKNVKLIDATFLNNLKSVIQYNKLKNLQIVDFATSFTIKDGNLNLQPFKTAFANQPITIGGVYNMGGILDFRVDATVDKEILSNDILNMIAYIPGNQNIKKIDVGIDIKGDAKKPDVKFDTDKIKKQVVDQVKNSSKEELQDAAKKLINQFFK